MIEIEKAELEGYMRECVEQLIRNFKPNSEFGCPQMPAFKGKESTERVVLRDLPEKSLVQVSCPHPSANYILRVGDENSKGMVDIWQYLDHPDFKFTNGFTGPAENLFSVSARNEDGRYPINQGVLGLEYSTAWPYFEYSTGRESRRVLELREEWWEKPRSIIVQLPR